MGPCIGHDRGVPAPLQVLDFFRGFRPISSSLRLDSAGRGSSGTGTLEFESSRDAYRAVRELNFKYMGRRYVELEQK